MREKDAFCLRTNPGASIKQTGYVGSPETVASKILEKDETGTSYITSQYTPAVATIKNFKKKGT